MDATLNWWGSNEDPSSQFYGSNILYDPWIVLTINADPATIYNTQRSTITANLLYDSRSLTDPNNPAYYHAPELGCVPDTPVTFDADSLGDLTPSKPHNTTVPSGQNVTVVFTALNSGVSEVNATVDDETVKTSINIIPQIEDVYVATAADGGSDSNDGSSSNPFLTLEKAINAVIAGGRIHIANGVYKDPLDRGLILTKNMTIFQDNWITGTGTSVIIDADSDGRIFLIDSGATVTLQNITMVNSTGFDGVGGAILNLGTLNVLNCRFSDNEADYYGGAIYNYGDLSVYNSIFTENLVSDWSEYFVGGAICNMANMNVTNCTFTHNTAGTGGAISSQTDPGYTMIITGNMFTGNSATNYGGAFYIYNGDYTSNIIQFNRIVGNTASQGDGIYTDHGSVNATLNWWGSNTDPSTISNLFVAVSGGSVVSDPWLVLRTCADPDSIYNGQTSTVTANLLYDSGILTDRDHSERYYHNPANGHVPDGIPVIFNLIDGPLGTLTSQTTFLNGAASIIFTATHIGIQHVNATIDYENATSTINIDPIGHVNITKNADNYAPDYWSLVTFTVNAYNEGPNDVEGLQITDLIPSGLTIISSNTHGFGTYSAGLWNIGTLTNGTTAILTLVVNATSTGTFTNWANVTTQTTHDISTWSKDNATITVPAATYLTISKQFQDLPWGNVITTAYYNDKIYAIVKVHNQGPDSTSSVDVLDRLDGFTWTGNYYVYRTVGSYPNTESAWVLNDQDYPFNGTNWNVGALSTMIGSERWLAIELVVNQTGTVSNYAETVNQSTYPYKGYDNDTTYLTANITPTNINMGDVRGDKGDTVTFKAVLTDYQANALEGETVEFWIDGVKVGENATDSTGTARFNYVITETPGSHNLMAVFGETGLYQGCNATGELYVPTANLYIQITSDRNNPTVGEKFTVTYKLGNQGPDDADNVTIIIPIPEGFHVLNIYGDGNWTVNDNGTITWTFTTVAVGDPYLYLYGYALKGGNFLFTASIFSDTYNINSIGVTSLVLNAVPRETAATTETTFGMQNTGIPLHGMVLAILMVLGGFISNWKKQ
ncbi:DUF1565 domain-containing protein [Methanobacterium petrolearium]|uniref:DUF1565 domain-containing protein n=1 Tax=Methanobacterium petrolearium TaxID=710190 RepID=UPI003081349D|nr:hypothetical protein GCM10025861_18160 [Methanobacterium petrolearium]